MVTGNMPPTVGRPSLTTARKKQRPLIRYAGSAAETSIGSKPIGSELNLRVYLKRHFCQAGLALAQSRAYLPALRQTAAPKAGEITVTLCPVVLFVLAHAECPSQSDAPNTAPQHAVAGMTHEQNRWPR